MITERGRKWNSSFKNKLHLSKNRHFTRFVKEEKKAETTEVERTTTPTEARFRGELRWVERDGFGATRLECICTVSV